MTGFIAALLLLPTNVGTGAAVGAGFPRRVLMVVSFLGTALGAIVFFAAGLPSGNLADCRSGK